MTALQFMDQYVETDTYHHITVEHTTANIELNMFFYSVDGDPYGPCPFLVFRNDHDKDPFGVGGSILLIAHITDIQVEPLLPDDLDVITITHHTGNNPRTKTETVELLGFRQSVTRFLKKDNS